jgi:tetratricopeptide (TPR) repeat protein
LRIARLIREPHLSAGHFDTAMMHATRAIAVDARDADAFEVRGTAGYERVRAGVLVDQRDIDAATNAAEADLRQAIALAPRQATAWNELSLVEQGKMNVIEANNAARRAYEADAYLYAAPDIVYRLWSTSYDLEQFADAIHWCDVGHQRFAGDPRFFRCRLFLMWTPAVAADPNEAWRLVHEITRRTPAQDVEFDRRFVEIAAAVVIGRAGLRDSAHHVLERARVGTDVDPQGELIGFEGVARARLGENDEAIRLTERFLTNHPDHRDFTKLNAWWWRELLKDPRFKKLAGAGS